VVATGERHSVREFVEKAFAFVGRSIEWRGSGIEEKGIDANSGQVLIEVDARYFRPTEGRRRLRRKSDSAGDIKRASTPW
jgi:GDPmannose 4,6-dehydratase